MCVHVCMEWGLVYKHLFIIVALVKHVNSIPNPNEHK